MPAKRRTVSTRSSKDVFITRDFLLRTKWAQALYHDYAAHQPIVDYHCHLPPEDVAADTRFTNLTHVWLKGDHYKWRGMRSNGVNERFVTGEASDWEKYQAWAATVPKCLRNPLYHWTHLELKRPFGISDRLLNPDTAKSIWDDANALLKKPEFSARGIMRQMNVAVVCTTDDPTDSLEHHIATLKSGFEIQMRPTWRPDKGMAVESPERFNAWVDKLAAVSNTDITDFDSYLVALRNRHDFFHANGCRLSDHGLETVPAADYTEKQIRSAFTRIRGGAALDADDQERFKSAMLHEGALMDHASGWVQQFHIGPIRNNSTRMFRTLGPDTGFDSIGDASYAKPLAKFLDRLDTDNRLAKTILYNINPKENHVLGTMIGNFQDGSVPGKVQFGSGWWFLDQKDGMEQQLNALSNLGLLSRFVGMLTDSRSFLSYTRHEYFRRILCNLLGDEMEAGLLPRDVKLLGGLVEDVCYRNAAGYFDFGLNAGTSSAVSAKNGKKSAAKR
jgi:glucuronate isomerase